MPDTTFHIKSKAQSAARRVRTVKGVDPRGDALNLQAAVADLSGAFTDLLGEVVKLRREVDALKKRV